MKNVIIFFIFSIFAMPSFAQKEVEVKTAGTLFSLISNNLKSITNLTISGEINNKDITVLKKMGTSEMLTTLNLSEVIIKDENGNITNNIPSEAFRGASKLETIILPQSAVFIGTYVIAGCNSLKAIVLPNNLTYIEESAFEDCEALSNISISKDNQYFKTEQNVLFSKDGSELILYPSNKNSIEYTIPIGVKNIKMGSFQFNNHIETLNFPETVEVVEGWTCRYLSNLKKLELPKSLKEIGPYAFCKNGVTEIYLKNSTPPVLDKDAFWKSKEYCKVFVPKDSYYNYWIDDLWSAFKSIEEYNYIDEGDVANEVINIAKDNIQIYSHNNGILLKVNSNSKVYIYTSAGRLVKTISAPTEQYISLSSGVYFLVNGSNKNKFIVE